MAQPEKIRIGTTTVAIPQRKSDMPSGTELGRQIRGLLGDTQGISDAEMASRMAKVDEFVYREFNRGNVPDFMRPENFIPVTLEKTIGGLKIQATIRACLDYLAIGSNSDYLLAPMSAPAAQRIADRFNFALPTVKLADVFDIKAKEAGSFLPFFQAPTLAVNVTNPHTGKPVIDGEKGRAPPWKSPKLGAYEGRWMLSGEFIEEQNRRISEERDKAGHPGAIRSGHKKDILYDIYNFYYANEGGQPVIIYRPPFQGLSNQHNVMYFDYSHGVRFIDGDVRLTITEKDGTVRQQTKPFVDVLKDSKLYGLVSHCMVDATRLYRNMPIPQSVKPKKEEPQLVH